MLEPGAGVGVEAEMDGLRRELLADLPPGASSLLFRVSLLVGAFDRDMAVRLGEATPAIAEPGAAVDLLTGPWLEPAADGRLRISPVLSGAGLKVLSESEQTRFHEAIAEFLARADPSGPETCLSWSSPACGRGRRRRSVWWRGSPWGGSCRIRSSAAASIRSPS